MINKEQQQNKSKEKEENSRKNGTKMDWLKEIFAPPAQLHLQSNRPAQHL